MTTTKTLDSNCVIKGLFAKATIIADIYKAFYNLITVGVSDPGGKTRFIYGEYPDHFINATSNRDQYPFIIINSPNLKWGVWLFKKKMIEGTITIEVFSAKNKEADTLTDSMVTAIEGQAGVLWGNGLRNMLLESIDHDHFIRGKISVHSRVVRFSFKYPMAATI